MAEPNRYEFSYEEVATALVKQQNLREGIWGVTLRFGIGASLAGPSPDQPVPTALVPVVSIGLAKMPKESNIAVDAAKVNPSKPLKKRQGALISRARQ